MRRLSILAAAVAMNGFARPAVASDHAIAVTAFARIMADVRTAEERCPDLAVDWNAVAAAKDRIGIADVDYFGFRRQAHDMADELEAQLSDDATRTAWCADIVDRYGPEGRWAAGLVRR